MKILDKYRTEMPIGGNYKENNFKGNYGIMKKY